jgi:hypothetical protein
LPQGVVERLDMMGLMRFLVDGLVLLHRNHTVVYG